ncbi:MAG: MinD/ParA family protein [Burkholderiales bacterium]
MLARQEAGTQPVSLDQASGLRRMLTRSTVRVLPVIGHEGSHWVATMLARALVGLGERVLLIDQGDGACGRMLGTEPAYSLDELVAGHCEYADAISIASSNVQLALIRDQLKGLKKRGLTVGQLLGAFAHAPEPADLVLIHFSQPAAIARIMDIEGEILLTTGGNPASIRSTYLTIKRTCARPHRYRVVVVGEPDESSAAQAHSRISGTALRFLGIAPEFEGAVPSASFPSQDEDPSTTAGAFAQLATRALAWRLAEFPTFDRDGDQPAVAH